MDDWKLKTMSVVRIERPNKTFVHFICLFVLKQFNSCWLNYSHKQFDNVYLT